MNTQTKQQLIILSSSLLKAMQQNSKVIKKTTPLPVLEMYLMKVIAGEKCYNSSLQIVTTDLEISVLNTIPCEAKESFNFLLTGDCLKFLQKLDEQPITITIKGDEVLISTESEKCKYSTYDAGDFPKIPQVETSAEIDLSLIGGFLPFCGHDELRPVMTGVSISNGEKGLRLCATDAHRLKVAKIEGTGIVASIIVPAITCKLLDQFKAGNVKYGVSEDMLYIRLDINERLSIVSRLIEGNYPKFDAVIPEKQMTFLKAPRKEMINTIDKALLFANESTKQVHFIIKETTLVSSQDVDYNKEFTATRNWCLTGNEMQIGVNGGFMVGILKDLQEDQITIEMSLPNRAVTINEGNTMWLCIPVLVK